MSLIIKLTSILIICFFMLSCSSTEEVVVDYDRATADYISDGFNVEKGLPTQNKPVRTDDFFHKRCSPAGYSQQHSRNDYMCE